MGGMFVIPLACAAHFDAVKTIVEALALATDPSAAKDVRLMFLAVLVDMAMSTPTTLLTVSWLR
jgi:hypothetical protein